MTSLQVIAVTRKYSEIIRSRNEGLEPRRNQEAISDLERLAHLLWMCDQIVSFVADDKIEKAMRWLGFVQGYFWTTSMASIEELKNDNR